MVIEQTITNKFAAYNGDCIEVMQELKENSVHLSIYSPPFAGLYQYSSDEKDISNCIDYKEFLRHYAYCVDEIARITIPGRMTAVHCMDVPTGNTGCDQLRDFPGDIIRLHKKRGFQYVARYHVWKEPLTIRNRTMMKSLSHKAMVHDSTRCSMANADYLLIFRKIGENNIPVIHPVGLTSYAGERPVPADILHYRGQETENLDWQNYDHDKQLKNRFSQWVWRQYASAFWDDVRLDRVLPYKEGKDPEDEKHVHPLQLDVIERAVVLWSNPGEVVLTPFMGVGSEVYGAVINGRKGIGIELKPSYYRQAVRNLENAEISQQEELGLFE
jgi:DNA modification methylase